MPSLVAIRLLVLVLGLCSLRAAGQGRSTPATCSPLCRCDEDGGADCSEIGDYLEEEGALLSFRTPQLGGFAEVSKKGLYSICVKVLHRTSLDGLKESRWLGLLAPGSSPQGSWRSLYKPPIEKRAGDLQWRIVHGAVATNRHVAHIGPTIGSECPFCGREEAVEHLFLHCVMLTGQGKLAVWLTRKNKTQGSGTLDLEPMLRAAVWIRLRIEYAYFKMTHNLPSFHRVGFYVDVLTLRALCVLVCLLAAVMRDCSAHSSASVSLRA
ncbi:hypothetical protein MHYP_G00297220 [Metynnis hypsauchen]